MRTGKRRPSWWQLYLLLPALGVLGLLESRVSLTATGHRILEAGVLLVVFGLVAVWLRANEGSMLREIDERVAHAVRRPSATPVWLPPDFTIATDSNGNSHRPSSWHAPESAMILVDCGEEDQDE